MKVTIGRCPYCKVVRLIDHINDMPICFNCKREKGINRRLHKRQDILAAKDK